MPSSSRLFDQGHLRAEDRLPRGQTAQVNTGRQPLAIKRNGIVSPGHPPVDERAGLPPTQVGDLQQDVAVPVYGEVDLRRWIEGIRGVADQIGHLADRWRTVVYGRQRGKHAGRHTHVAHHIDEADLVEMPPSRPFHVGEGQDVVADQGDAIAEVGNEVIVVAVIDSRKFERKVSGRWDIEIPS